MLLALAVAVLATAVAAQKDCLTASGPIVHGSSASGPDCQRHSCQDGVLRVQACPPVPVGCTAVDQDETKSHPDCCTRWCCGAECAGVSTNTIDRAAGGAGAANLISGCYDGRKVIAHGGSALTRNCTKLSCVDGILKTEVCPGIPTGCRYTTKEDRSRGYPHCCPTFCCGNQCPPPPGTRGSPDCVFEGSVLPNGYWRSTSDCRRTTCDNGRLRDQRCPPPSDPGCYLTFIDKRQQYPDCCPHYCCGITCPLTATVPAHPALQRTECLFEDHIVLPNGGLHYTSKCEEYRCDNGVLRVRHCRPVPPGCRPVPQDRTRPFPGCCDSWHHGCQNRRRFRALDTAEAEAPISVCPDAGEQEDGNCVPPEQAEEGELVQGEELVEEGEPADMHASADGAERDGDDAAESDDVDVEDAS